MQTYLVTGAAGFIGSNLVEHLLSEGHRVIGMDSFTTGHAHNLESVNSHPAYNFIEGDIRNLESCRSACEEVDIILHQAALGSVPRSINDPLTSNEANVTGFLNMLISARDHNVKRFVYAASSSTYGDSKSMPKQEDIIGRPLSPYAVTKYVNELYADVFAKTYGMECIGLRYFNVFGPRQDPNGAYAAVIPKFIIQFLNGESPTINGDGSFSRDFTYIENVIQANMLAANTQNPVSINQVYNVAYGQQTDLKTMTEVLKEELSQFRPEIADIPIIFGEERKGDVPHSLADISKARELLGYDPKYDFKKGIQKCVKWYYENYS